MKLIREADTLIGLLEEGDLKRDLSSEIARIIARLHELSEDSPKKKFSGTLKLVMKLSVENGIVTVSNDMDAKLPKMPRRTDVFWTTEDGALSTEHPKQTDMFAGPRAIENRQQQ